LVAVPADEIEVPFTAVKRLLFRVVSSIPQFAEFVEHIIGKLLGAARRFVHDFPRPDAVVTVGLVLLSALLRAVTTVSFIYLGEAQWLTFDPASTSFFLLGGTLAITASVLLWVSHIVLLTCSGFVNFAF